MGYTGKRFLVHRARFFQNNHSGSGFLRNFDFGMAPGRLFLWVWSAVFRFLLVMGCGNNKKSGHGLRVDASNWYWALGSIHIT